MNFIESISLFGIMMVLAAIPSTSVALVVARSATLGIANGIAVSAGIVLGDLVFILLAILGLSVVAETMGSLFVVIKHLGGLYLIWLGISLLRAKNTSPIAPNRAKKTGNLITSFIAGFVLTLGDVKAILFYVSLFPMFIDLSTLSAVDMLVIMLVTIGSVGGVKVVYALSATRVASFAANRSFDNAAKKTAGGLMVGAGSYLVFKA